MASAIFREWTKGQDIHLAKSKPHNIGCFVSVQLYSENNDVMASAINSALYILDNPATEPLQA